MPGSAKHWTGLNLVPDTLWVFGRPNPTIAQHLLPRNNEEDLFYYYVLVVFLMDWIGWLWNGVFLLFTAKETRCNGNGNGTED